MTAAPAPAFQPSSRTDNLARLREAPLDVLILGGGINGAGIARDLALRAYMAGRPLRIGLVEQRQFGSGTSGRNSQLLHGGLRYLKNLEFRLVREALAERSTLLRIAPHLVEPLPFLLPFPNLWARIFYGVGLFLYDLLAGEQNIGRRRYLSGAAVHEMEPRLDPRHARFGAIYYDCKVHSARVTLENVFDAARLGAIAVNYVRAGKPKPEDGGHRVALSDQFGGEFSVFARRVVDARGPWDDSAALRLVRGSHIVLPAVCSSGNAIAHFGPDGRIIFFIPWGPQNSLTLVGTTDADHAGPPDDVRISPEEIRYLLAVVTKLFPESAGVRPLAAYSSLRPLVKSEEASATRTSREHRIWLDADQVVRITGGKYTTYRAMSAEAADLAVPELRGTCATGRVPLGGNAPEDFSGELDRIDERASQYRTADDEVHHLTRLFGRQIHALLQLLPEAPPPGLSRSECAVLSYCARHEMAQRLADVLFVATYWGYERQLSPELVRAFADEMGRHLGWDGARREQEAALALRIAEIPEY